MIDTILKFKTYIFVCIILTLFILNISGLLLNPQGSQRFAFMHKGSSTIWADTFEHLVNVGKENLYFDKGVGDPRAMLQHYNYYTNPSNFPPFAFFLLYGLNTAIDMPSFDNEIEKTWNAVLFVSLYLTFLFAILFIQLYDLKEGGAAMKFFVALSLMCSSIVFLNYRIANPVILSSILITFFIVNYKNSNKIIHEFALIALACAANLKIMPCVFGILLLYNKQYMSAIRACVYALILLIAPFFFFANEQYSALDNFIAFFKIITDWLGAVNVLSHLGGNPVDILGVQTQRIIENISDKIFTIMAIISLVAGYFLKVQWKKVALIAMCFIVFTKGGIPYILLIVLPVIVMFLNEKEMGGHLCRLDILYLIGFIVFANPFQIRPWDFGLTVFLAKATLTGIFILLFYESIVAFLDYRKSCKIKKIGVNKET